MQRLEVSGAVRLMYRSLGVKGLILYSPWSRVLRDKLTVFNQCVLSKSAWYIPFAHYREAAQWFMI